MPDDLRSCPICWSRFGPNGRQIYCTDRCRKTAYQRRQRHAADFAPAHTDAGRPPVDEHACPHCGTTITVITLITTPQAARPRPQPLPDPGARAAFAARPVPRLTTMPEQQIRRERLDITDAIELAETLAFLRHWISGRDHDQFAQSLDKFIGVDGDHLADLQADLARFAFLLGDHHGERLLTVEPHSPLTARRCDPTTPDTGALRYAPSDV